MFLQFSKSMYAYILEVEMMIFMRYKINPYEMEKFMTIIDFQTFVMTFTKKIEDENNSQDKNGNKLMKSLVAIRDILNYMTLNDSAVR